MATNEEQLKKPKKFAVGEVLPSPSTSTKRTRHHVKRRSSSRVHVSKLAPMAKHDAEEKPMKRTQSNKSLHRLTNLEVTPDEQHTPPTTPPLSNQSLNEVSPPTTDLITPTHSQNSSSTESLKKLHLKSQFIDHQSKPSKQPTRTQQKLLLQREQSLVYDENNLAHPKNMLRLTREMERMAKEYHCVRTYQDPMMDSLSRIQSLSTNTTSHSFVDGRKQNLLQISLQNKKSTQDEENVFQRWSATKLFERWFFGP